MSRAYRNLAIGIVLLIVAVWLVPTSLLLLGLVAILIVWPLVFSILALAAGLGG